MRHDYYTFSLLPLLLSLRFRNSTGSPQSGTFPKFPFSSLLRSPCQARSTNLVEHAEQETWRSQSFLQVSLWLRGGVHVEDTKNEDVYIKCPRKSRVKTTPGGNLIDVQNIACNITSVWLKSPKICTRLEANHTPRGRFHWLQF